MILIGENIHVISKRVREALLRRDEEFICELLKLQNNMDYVDLNAGPARGEMSGILPWLANLVAEYTNLNISFDTSNFDEMKKLIEGGHQILEADLPVLVTMTMPHDYAAKYPSFMAAHKAQDKAIHTWTAADIGADPHKLGLEGSPTRVDRIFPPPARPKGEMFSGSAVELADKFVEILKKESVIK